MSTSRVIAELGVGIGGANPRELLGAHLGQIAFGFMPNATPPHAAERGGRLAKLAPSAGGGASTGMTSAAATAGAAGAGGGAGYSSPSLGSTAR